MMNGRISMKNGCPVKRVSVVEKYLNRRKRHSTINNQIIVIKQVFLEISFVINVIKYISEKKVDFFSQNDIIIEINYGNYKIKSDIILNNNNPIIDNEYIIKYKKEIPLIINVYDSNNTFGNVILYKKIINNLKKKNLLMIILNYIMKLII